MKGTVKFFNEMKGFGFIKVEGEDDHFFHLSEVANQEILNEGDEVEFNSVTNDRGLQAQKVTLITKGE